MNSISWFVYTVHGNKNMAIQKSNLFNEYLLLFMRRPVLIFWVLTMCTAGLSAFHVFVSFSQTTLGVRYWFFFQFAYVQTELRVSEWFARGLYASEEFSSESKPGSSESRIRTFQHHTFRIPTSNRKQNWWCESKWGKRTPARCRGRDASNPRGGGRSGKYASRALERRGEHGAQRAGEGIGARTSGLSGDGSLITTNCLSPLHAC